MSFKEEIRFALSRTASSSRAAVLRSVSRAASSGPELVEVDKALGYILVARALSVYIGKPLGRGAHLALGITAALLLYVTLYANTQALGLFE